MRTRRAPRLRVVGGLVNSLVASACLSLIGIALSAHTEVPADFRELVAEAELIIRGHVTDVQSVSLVRDEISSAVTIAVDASLKGSSGPFVSVLLPGGDAGRTRVVMVGAPRLRLDDAAVFLLRRGPDNVFRLVGLSSGLYRLQRDPATGRVGVAPPAIAGSTADAGPVVRGDARRAPVTVSEFDALVRLVVAGRRLPIERGRP